MNKPPWSFDSATVGTEDFLSGRVMELIEHRFHFTEESCCSWKKDDASCFPFSFPILFVSLSLINPCFFGFWDRVFVAWYQVSSSKTALVFPLKKKRRLAARSPVCGF